MTKRTIIAGVIVVLLAYAGFIGYQKYRADKRLSGGLSGQDVRGGDVTTADGEELQPQPSRSDTPEPNPRKEVTSSQTAYPASAATGTGAPATDSIAPNPPNGMAFAGNGKFQVYRQGNLTWRVNTDNGSSCILFATNDEWRKPIVYSHGCGNS